MIDSIVVNVSELRTRLQDIRRSGAEYVRLSISEPDGDPNDEDFLPACIDLSAYTRGDTVWKDFEEVEAVPDNAELLKHSSTSPHCSY